jgi:hypothetical protein
MMHPLLRTSIVGTVVLASSALVAGRQRDSAPQCKPAGSIAPVKELPEASGLAVGRRVPGRLWAHNDSGDPVLFALDARGVVTGRVQITGATVDDWEALAVGPCGSASCLYIGDIGDNGASRSRITIYRVPEPAANEKAAAVQDALHATYPDGAHDAEALFVMPDGGMFIVTKGETGSVALYRFPKDVRAGASHTLERVGKPRGAGEAEKGDRITDAGASPTGDWILLRSVSRLTFHRPADLLTGNWQPAATVDLVSVGETQGEGVAIGPDATVYLAGEGGGKSRAGTFARLTCTVRP